MRESNLLHSSVSERAGERSVVARRTRWGVERELGLDSPPWRLGFLALAGMMGLVLVFLAIHPFVAYVEKGGDHYTYLAQSFTQGRLSVDSVPDSYADVVLWHGHKYLPFGPLPAVLLIPFLPILQAGFPSVSIGHLFTLINMGLFYAVLGRAGIIGARRRWALLLFFFSTSYFSTILDLTADNSWLLAQVITATCLLLAFWETLGRRRPALMGFYLGLAALTRFTTLFCLPFFVWMIWRNPKSEAAGLEGSESADTGARTIGHEENGAGQRRGRLNPSLVRPTLMFFAGLVGPVALLFAYNYARFGNPLESGYSQAALYYNVLNQARAQGLFSLVHIPKNLVMFLFQGPVAYPSINAPVLEFPYLVPSPWGMSILLTTPAIAYALRANLKQPLVQACWLGVLFTMLPIFTYYGIGYVQFGYRYALDFIPLLVILAAIGFGAHPSRRVGALVLIGMAVNLWGVLLLTHRA